ncbi:ferredoxin-type protein NapF [Sinobacterium norvegicum]|nr:ferredoxin-type protein NapF [Sinobacterium norvegicum]
MNTTLDRSRRFFISGGLADNTASNKVSSETTLPWLISQSAFDANCTRCGDCLTACPEDIIVKDDNGFPTINFSQSGCDFCGDCAASCKQDIFLAAESRTTAMAWQQDAHINENCLAYQNVMCMSCLDSCDASAISFNYQHKIARPSINISACTGCGFCQSSCPTHAISITPIAAENATLEHYEHV